MFCLGRKLNWKNATNAAKCCILKTGCTYIREFSAVKNVSSTIKSMGTRRSQMSVNFAKSILAGIILFYVILPVVTAHEEMMEPQSFFDQSSILLFAGVIIVATVLMILPQKNNLTDRHKKIMFLVIALAAGSTTLYLVANTVYTAVTSWSGGLIHWHADFEIWICGERIHLPKPTGLANRVGTAEVHDHGDDRIHLEGVMKTQEEASVGHFFDIIGVPFSNEIILNMQNGNYCPDGKQGTVKMFVNGKPYEGDYRSYVIAPYALVPPGDTIKIVFE